MASQADFDAFLSDIEPSLSAVNEISVAHNTLRNYLSNHETYGEKVTKTFLSGSYAKHTAIRNAKDSEKRDVDIVVELGYDTSAQPDEILQELCDVLKERAAYSTAHIQSHSVGIELAAIKMDVVPLAVEDGKRYIGNGKDGSWSETDPAQHKMWSTDINAESGCHYKPLVKILKWWRKENCTSAWKYPKGIVLEKLVADRLPEEYDTMEDYLIEAMRNLVEGIESILAEYRMPYVEDPAIVGSNMASGYGYFDFSMFKNKLEEHLELLVNEGTGNATWQKVLGNRFPASSASNTSEIVRTTCSKKVPHVPWAQTPTWTMAAHRPSIVIGCSATYPGGLQINVGSGEVALPKHAKLSFRAMMSGNLRKGRLYWQVVNTGDEAEEAHQLRGGFEESKIGSPFHTESTLYSGMHYIKCYLVSKGICLAYSKPFLVNIQ